MVRLVLALVAAAALAGAAWLLYGPIEGWTVELRLIIVSVATIVLSIAAIVVAIRSQRRTAALRADLSILIRSIDVALRDFAERSTKDVATIGEMNEHVAHELEKIATTLLSREDGPRPALPPQVDNVVAMPASKRSRPGPADALTSSLSERGSVEAAYRKAIAAGSFEISLQPIISVTQSAAAGFEAFASLPVDGRPPVDIRRVAETLPGLDSAAFERILINSALHAGRRRLGSAGADMPVHVAISEAILSDPQEVNAVVDAIALYPELAKAVVLSVPVALFDRDGPVEEALARLAANHVRFAAEGWIEGTDSALDLAESGVAFLKISTNRLLDRERSRRRLGPAAAIIEVAAAADITVVAADVMTDEDAVSLIDLGLDLMIGERFSGPRRLKAEGDRASRIALI